MRTSPALLAIETAAEPAPPCLGAIVRALAELLEKLEADTVPEPTANKNGGEEILLDTELDGSRYLLLRMPRPGANRVQLSPREQEIVRMVAKGHPNKVIADVLNISCWTVCTHLRRIFAKLGVGSRAAMVAQLLEIGAISLDSRTRPDER